MTKLQIKFPILLRNICISILSDFFLHLGNALVMILISRKLGGAAAGSYNIGLTLFFFGSFLAYWGFGNLLTREVAKNHQNFAQYFSNLGATRLFFGLISALIIIVMALIIPNYPPETRLIVMIMALGLPASALANLCQSAFFAFEKFEITGLVSVIVMLIKLVLAWMAMQLLSNPLVWLAVITLAINLLTLLILFVLMNRHLPASNASIDTKFIFERIKIAFPFFLIAIFMATDNRIDVLMISMFLNTESVGYYSAMTTILGVLYLLPDALRNAVLPALSRYRQVDLNFMKARFYKIVRYSLLVTIPIVFLGYLFSDLTVGWVYGNQFEISADLLRISIGSLISYSIMTVYNRLLIVEGKEKQVMTAILISALITVLLNLLLIKSFGLEGAAFVKLATSALSMGLCILLVRKNQFSLKAFGPTGWILLSALILLGAYWFTRQFSIIVQSLVCLAVYGIAILLLPVFSTHEKQNLRKSLCRLLAHD